MPKQAIEKLKIELAKNSLRLLDVYRFKNKDLLRVLDLTSRRVLLIESPLQLTSIASSDDLAKVVERITQALKEK
ncbi:MAG: hypothetical protein N3E36_00610 [Sulfolobales archaeon]|nr:hypothetical protein [Sulfolobales archaeon]MCX8198525.1 hypothetical protein [Sulfolobales archaeon]MDW8169599.1 hypothetical protein [Desulfurococcaceae archaeon]